MADHARFTTRGDDLAIQELGDELLIYDRTRDVAHCLSEPAAQIWRACQDSAATLDELTLVLVAEGTHEQARATAERAVDELREKELLEELRGGVSRRHVLARIAGVGGGALAAPLVVSAAVPRSAEAFKSPVTCGGSGTACTTKNSYGTSTTNTCCGPGTKSCPKAVGTGSGGCYCNPSGSCANCVGSNATVSATTCGDGACPTKGATNRCCCSGLCSSTSTGKCA